MDKITALDYVEANLKQDVEEAARQLTGEALAARVGELQDLRGEVGQHRLALSYADLACADALSGHPPVTDEGLPYDPYDLLVEALHNVPSSGRLSPALLGYLEELPARRQRTYEEQLHALRSDPDLQRIWFESPAAKLTEQASNQEGIGLFTRHVEATNFTQTYADDLAQALRLAEQHGDWTTIRECLA